MQTDRFAPLILASAVLALAPTPARADDAPFSLQGSASVLSQYRFRGLSRSDGQPAVQGDLSISNGSGLYGGVTLSSEEPGAAVDFGHGELDLYAGKTVALGNSGYVLDLGARGYLYLDRSGADLFELSAALDHQIGPIDVRAGAAYAPPQGNLGRAGINGPLRDNTYVFAESRTDIPGTPLHLHAHLGHTAGGLDYTGAYWDYRLGIGASHKAFGLDLSLVGTNVSQAAAATTPDPVATWRAARRAGVISLSYQF